MDNVVEGMVIVALISALLSIFGLSLWSTQSGYKRTAKFEFTHETQSIHSYILIGQG
jgi:hypothetical protein